MKKTFSEWFNHQQKLRPDLNLGGIRKLLNSAFVLGWETAFARGWRSGYNERDKEEPVVEVVVGDVPLNPSPVMIETGAAWILALLSNDKMPHSNAEIEMARTTAERVWRTMWAAKEE